MTMYKDNGILDILEMGAVGDGTTDCSNAFKRAEAAPNAEVYLPQGTYVVNSVTLTKIYKGPGVIKLNGTNTPSNEIGRKELASSSGGAEIGLADAGNHFTTKNVEAAFQQVAGNQATDESNISTIQGKQTTDESNISTNTSNISTIQGKQTTDESNISTLQTNQTTDEGHISTNTTNISTIQGKQSTDESNISTLQTNQTTDESNISKALKYDVNMMFVGKPTADQTLFRFTATQNLTIPANLAGSFAHLETAATANATIGISAKLANGSTASVGQVDFAAGSYAAGTFSVPAGSITSLAPGDQIYMTGPATADSTMAGISMTLALSR